MTRWTHGALAVSIEELSGMDPVLQERRMDELMRAATGPVNDEAAELDDEIRAFEHDFGFASDEMERRLAVGRLVETSPVCQWLMLLQLRRLREQRLKHEGV